MRIEYDRQIDAAYVYFAETEKKVTKTVPLDPREIQGEITVDFDREGRIVGVEIQDASRFLDSSLLPSE